jgi:hypothetical protein
MSSMRTLADLLTDHPDGVNVALMCDRCGASLGLHYVGDGAEGWIDIVEPHGRIRASEAEGANHHRSVYGPRTQRGVYLEMMGHLTPNGRDGYYRRRCSSCGQNDKRDPRKLGGLRVDPRRDPPIVWF